MSVWLPTVVIIALAVVIVLLGVGQLLLFRQVRPIGAGSAAPAAPDGKPGADRDSPVADADGDAPAIAPPDPTAAMAAAMTEAARAGAEAAAAGIREWIEAALAAHRDDLKAWAETAVIDAADRQVKRRLEEAQDRFAADLRRADEARARAGQAEAPAPAALETAAPEADRAGAAAGLAAAEPAIPGGPGSEAPRPSRLIERLVRPPVPQPPNPRLDLTRPASYDLLGEASQWLDPLGFDETEMARLRANATASEPAEGLRKLFGCLHAISAERRLASDRRTLKWDRVERASLAEFIGRIHPGVETCLIWPHVGDAYDPRTMYHLQKSESGPGELTEVVAPGYSIGAGEDPVKAAIID